MSPNVANSLVHDLVEMAKAMEQLPQVQNQLVLANTMIDEQAKTVQDREIRLLDLKAQIEELNTKLRSAEVARDDAEFRFLEVEEKSAQALDRIRQMGAIVGTVISQLDPPKPEPAVAPIPDPISTSGESAPLPPVATQTPSPAPTYGDASSSADAASQGSSSGMDESAAYPTANSPSGNSSPSAGSPDAEKNNDAVPLTSANSGPYSGKRYVDIPGYVAAEDWLAGGGTEADYHWRESSINRI